MNNRVKKQYYQVVWVTIGFYIFTVLGSYCSRYDSVVETLSLSLVVIGCAILSLGLLITFFVLVLRLLYTIFTLLQEVLPYRPFVMVLLFFIPIFNIYWYVKIVYALPRYVSYYGKSIQSHRRYVALIGGVLGVVSICFPYTGILILLSLILVSYYVFSIVKVVETIDSNQVTYSTT